MTLAVLCPGQGAQHSRMLDLASSDASAREALDEAAAALGVDPRTWTESDAMFVNANAQPLICVAQNAQWRGLRDRLPCPLAIAGYSVGELSCYGLAGAVGIAALVRLARQRAAAMDTATAEHAGGLVAVRGLVRRTIEAICVEVGAHVAIAAADDAFVVGAGEPELAEFALRCERLGVQARALRVGVAAHTPLLAAAVATFRTELDASTLRAPAIPVVAGIDAAWVRTRERAIATLAPQVAQTIEWAQCLDALHERGCRVFLELGPGQALSRMVHERFDDAGARSVDEFRSLAAIAAWVERECG